VDTLELMRVWNDEVWHAGRLDRVADCLADTYVRHSRAGHQILTPAEYAEEIRATRERIANLRQWNDDFMVSPDRFWSRWRQTGTNVETGEPVNISGLGVYRIVDGKLAEMWAAVAPDGQEWAALGE
jgi:hypothetical protein